MDVRSILTSGKIEASEVLVTPDLARERLTRNDKNRPVSQRLVEQYAYDMIAGAWKSNGETIKVSRTGRLVDGQHRLRAIVEADMPVRIMLVYGVDDDTFDTIDTGKRRTGGDALAVRGTLYANVVAGACRWIFAVKGRNANIRSKLSNAGVVQLASQYPGLEGSAHAVNGISRIVTPSLATAMHCLFAEKDRDEADRFWRDVKNGAGLAPNDPALVLRNRLIRDRGGKLRMNQNELLAVIIRAWNHRRAGTGITKLAGLVQQPDGSMSPVPEIE